MEQREVEKVKQEEALPYSIYAAIGAPYLLSLCGLHLFGYWGWFHINPLEYVGIGDLAAMAAYPLTISLLAIGFGVLLGHVIMPSTNLTPGSGRNTVVGKALNKYWRLLAAAWILATAAVVLYGPEPDKWYAFGLLVIPLSIVLSRWSFFVRMFPEQGTRTMMASLLLLAPSVSFAIGRDTASRLDAKTATMTVDIARSELPVLRSDKTHPIVLVGHLGNYFVLLESSTGLVVFVRASEHDALFFARKPRN